MKQYKRAAKADESNAEAMTGMIARQIARGARRTRASSWSSSR